MRSLPLILLLCLALFSKAGDIKYPASAIPDSLRKGAHVVKRMEEVEFRIINTSDAVLRKRWAITVLDENGDDYAALVEYYGKLQQIRSVEGALYDAMGVEIKRLKSKDVQDISAVDDNNLMDDNRRKVHQFFYRSYPYTVEYEVELRYNNTLFFPAWVPQDGEDVSVQQSSYTIVAPLNYAVRFRAFNYSAKPVETTEKNTRSMKWEVRNLEPVSLPYAAPSWAEVTTMILFAPSEFEIEDYKGTMSNWKEFGRFVHSLKKGRDELPESVQRKVKELTAGLNSEREKIRVLYEYLQKQTRYISIQLGLGGWQPFEAAYVAQKGYGDCKALTNYMYSLLKAAGITSNYTLVKAGRSRPIIEDFPSQQFNHVILSVPLGKDTVWLECTDQTLPAGYLSAFTANRKALVVNEEGGTLVSTPSYGLKENIQVRKIQGRLDGEGNLTMDVSTLYGGIQQDDRFQMIHALSREKVQKALQSELELSTYTVNSFDYQPVKASLPQLSEQLGILVSGYANVTGKRIFIQPNILNRSTGKYEANLLRKTDFVFELAYRDEDEYAVTIPEGYTVESAPEAVTLTSVFGTYSSSCSFADNKIIYRRVREQFSGRFPAFRGKELEKFLADIYKADRMKLVLVKKG